MAQWIPGRHRAGAGTLTTGGSLIPLLYSIETKTQWLLSGEHLVLNISAWLWRCCNNKITTDTAEASISERGCWGFSSQRITDTNTNSGNTHLSHGHTQNSTITTYCCSSWIPWAADLTPRIKTGTQVPKKVPCYKSTTAPGTLGPSLATMWFFNPEKGETSESNWF